MKTIKISREDFKLIKSFLPSFCRAKSILSNDFIIDWNELMPVVEKIESLIPVVTTKSHTQGDYNDFYIVIPDQLHHEPNSFGGSLPTKIQSVYKAVIEFIKFYNSQTQH